MSKATDKITLPNGIEVEVQNTDLFFLNRALDVLVLDYLRECGQFQAMRRRWAPLWEKMRWGAETGEQRKRAEKQLDALSQRRDYCKCWDRRNAFATALEAVAEKIGRETPLHPIHFAIQAKAAAVTPLIARDDIPESMQQSIAGICKVAGIKPLPKAFAKH